jgi:CheY-like chemotaxis protein
VIVVVVEDEARILDLCSEMLTQQGHEVHAFLGGDEALAFFAGRRADVLLADYRMPGMTGDELLDRARVLHPTLRGVLMTGQAPAAILAEAERRGFVVLAKPFTPEQLARALARAVAADSARC